MADSTPAQSTANTTTQPTVVALGELLWDMLPSGKRAGGAPVNFAYHAMKNGATSYAISAVGNDELGNELAATAENVGIHAILEHNDYPTSTVEIELKNGSPEYTIVEGVAWDYIAPNEQIAEVVQNADAICYGTLALRCAETHDTIIELLKVTKPTALRFFDINLRGDFYSKEIIEEALQYATVFKINDEELALLRPMFNIPDGTDEEACAWFIEHYDLSFVILTGGADFSLIISKTGERSYIGTPRVEVATTVGAGDSFSGTFTARLLEGDSVRDAHRKAVNTAAYVCTQEGAWPDYPTEIPDYITLITAR